MTEEKMSKTMQESIQASAFGSVIATFSRAFSDFFDSSLNSFFEFKQLHPAQLDALNEYNKFLKNQLKHSLGLWQLLLNAYSFSLTRDESKQYDNPK